MRFHLFFPFVLVLAVVGFMGCRFDDVATAPQAQTMAQLADQADTQQTKIDALEAEAGEILTSLPQALAQGDAAKVAQLSAQAETLQQQLEQAYAAHAAVVQQMEALAQEVLRPSATAVSGTASLIHPGLGMVVAGSWPLVAGLFFRRSRKHLAVAAQNVVKLDLGAALTRVLKSVGFQHSDDEYYRLLIRAHTMAFEAGDTETVQFLSELLDKFGKPVAKV
jgi:hypothetical protein